MGRQEAARPPDGGEALADIRGGLLRALPFGEGHADAPLPRRITLHRLQKKLGEPVGPEICEVPLVQRLARHPADSFRAGP